MKKNRAQKDILYISISSFILVVIWVGTNIYHASVDSTIKPSLQTQIEPIEPRFDTDTIEVLKKREKVSPSFEIDTTSSAPATTTPIPLTPEEPKSSSQSGSLEILGE